MRHLPIYKLGLACVDYKIISFYVCPLIMYHRYLLSLHSQSFDGVYVGAGWRKYVDLLSYLGCLPTRVLLIST